MKNYKT